MKHSVMRCCCCGGPPDIWREKPPEPEEYVSRIADLMRELECRYGKHLDMSVEDPSDFLALWDIFRYRIRSDTPVWILEGKKTFEGVPALDQLFGAIDARLEGKSAAGAESAGNPG
jgi:hypothetical protein